MSSQVPIVRPVSWFAVTLQSVSIGLIAGVGYSIAGRDGLVIGAGLFVLYSVFARSMILRHHRAGISLVKRQRFQEAIQCFESGLRFFARYPWIDRYRSVLLMSAAAMTYREMGLANIAYCYSQNGDGMSARRYYEACLEQFPQNGLATAALRMMDSAANAPAKYGEDAP